MKDKYYEDILLNIQRYVPEFKSIFAEDEKYPLMFEFGQFLTVNITNDELLKRAILLIDEALCTGSDLIEDLIVLQVFQLFYQNKDLYLEFRKHLSGSTLVIFEKYHKEYNKFYK